MDFLFFLLKYTLSLTTTVYSLIIDAANNNLITTMTHHIGCQSAWNVGLKDTVWIIIVAVALREHTGVQ